jgi:hypothetical protein
MDFQISKRDFTEALRQILQGRKADSVDLVDMTADLSTLTMLVTGRSIEIPIEAQERGSFSIPIGVLFKMKKISGTYNDKEFRIRVSDGKFRLQGMTTSHPGIKARSITRRIIDIPEDASAHDILSLPLIFSADEIEDCGLQVKLLEAQKKLADDLDSALLTIRKYGFERNELSAMVKLKIEAHADAMKHSLFESPEGI